MRSKIALRRRARRDFSLALVAAALEQPVERCRPLVDEAAAYGLVDQVGDAGEYRFVHALTREAVEASLTTVRRTQLHRAVAVTLEAALPGNPSERLSEIAGHWAELAPYGEAATARAWAIRAAEDAVRRLAFEEGVRLYRRAMAMESASESPAERCVVRIALGRSAYFRGRPSMRRRRHGSRRRRGAGQASGVDGGVCPRAGGDGPPGREHRGRTALRAGSHQTGRAGERGAPRPAVRPP